MQVFITGVAGFLGSHLADAMLKDGHAVVGIDNLIGGELDNVPSDVIFHQIDCNEFEYVRRISEGCDIFYHCAATAYEGLSVFSPHIVTQNIVSASVSMFSAAIANRAKRIVFCSSMARYGALEPPFTEDQAPKPQDPYGIGKLAAEEILRNLCETHGIEYVIAVPHNIIGPRQKYDDPFRNVASIMINLMLQKRQPIIYSDGKQKRCFSFIDDCLYCLKEMAFRPNVVGQVINIGPDDEIVTIIDLATRIANQLRFNLNPIFLPGRPQEVYARHLLVRQGAQAARLQDRGRSRGRPVADDQVREGTRHAPVQVSHRSGDHKRSHAEDVDAASVLTGGRDVRTQWL